MRRTTDIHERIFAFVVRGLRILPYLPKTAESRIIAGQYIRALTSCGANDNEADGASTRKDFIHCYSIVRKELKETYYWLRIIAEMYPDLKQRLHDLIHENEELILIISSIIRNTKLNKQVNE